MEGWLFGVLRGRGRNNTLNNGDCDVLIPDYYRVQVKRQNECHLYGQSWLLNQTTCTYIRGYDE